MDSKEIAEKYNLSDQDLQLYMLIVGTRVVDDKVEEKFINLRRLGGTHGHPDPRQRTSGAPARIGRAPATLGC